MQALECPPPAAPRPPPPPARACCQTLTQFCSYPGFTRVGRLSESPQTGTLKDVAPPPVRQIPLPNTVIDFFVKRIIGVIRAPPLLLLLRPPPLLLPPPALLLLLLPPPPPLLLLLRAAGLPRPTPQLWRASPAQHLFGTALGDFDIYAKAVAVCQEVV